MNNIQVKLIYLLCCAIRGEKAEETQIENVDWNELLNYASLHNIEALIYSALPKFNNSNFIENEILGQWKKDTIVTAIYQLQHLRQVENLIQKFNQNEIPLIALKGLVIRELYPKPEFRTMCDADILIRESDMPAAKEIMQNSGYFEVGNQLLHMAYQNLNHSNVEVHWTIRHHRFFKSMNELENKMWDRSEKISIGKSQALSFCTEDLAIHLCIHMATHFLAGGFGLRQLCDLVLLIEKRGDLIDWTIFYEKLRNWKIEKFTVAILLVCKKLFNMDIPEEFERYCSFVNSQLIEQLIEEILSGGVYGKRDLTNRFANELAYSGKDELENNLIRTFRKFLLLIFPPVSKISSKYNYVNKHKILIPFAWIHHIFSGIAHSQFGFVDKIKFFTITVPISMKRNKLFKNLGF